MTTTALGTAVEIPKGYNQEQQVVFTAQLVNTTVTAADTLTFTLPTRWQGKALTVLSVRAEKYTTSGATTGARTLTDMPIAVSSFVETTGVVSLLVGAVGAANTTTVNVYMLVSIAKAAALGS